MKVIYYLLVLVFGFVGVLAGLRTLEVVSTGGKLMPAQVVIAAVALILAVRCLRKARSV